MEIQPTRRLTVQVDFTVIPQPLYNSTHAQYMVSKECSTMYKSQQRSKEMTKWHSNSNQGKVQGGQEGTKPRLPYSDTQMYTLGKDGQFQLFPPPSMYQQVLTFLKDLRASDFD